MSVTVIYLGDGEVGEAVVYGLPFTVGEPVTLPDGFEFTGKIVNNGTFQVVADLPQPLPAAVEPDAPAPAAKTRGRPRKNVG